MPETIPQGLLDFLKLFSADDLSEILEFAGLRAGRSVKVRAAAVAEAILDGKLSFQELIEPLDVPALRESCEWVDLPDHGKRAELVARLVRWSSVVTARGAFGSESDPSRSDPLDGRMDVQVREARSEQSSAAWTWPPTGETFVMDGNAFVLDVAKERLEARPRPIVKALVSPLALKIGPGAGEIVKARLNRADVQVPVLAATLESGALILVDGWHRIAKAERLGLAELPCVVLSRVETRAVRVGEFGPW